MGAMSAWPYLRLCVLAAPPLQARRLQQTHENAQKARLQRGRVRLSLAIISSDGAAAAAAAAGGGDGELNDVAASDIKEVVIGAGGNLLADAAKFIWQLTQSGKRAAAGAAAAPAMAVMRSCRRCARRCSATASPKCS